MCIMKRNGICKKFQKFFTSFPSTMPLANNNKKRMTTETDLIILLKFKIGVLRY